MLNLTNAASVAVDYLYELGSQNVPGADDYKMVANITEAPTASLQLVKSSGGSTMIPMTDGRRVDQRFEMTQHRADTSPFERTFVVEARRMADHAYMTGVEESVFSAGEEKARHPNRIVFGALVNANSALYEHTKAGKTAKFPMVGIDGLPLLSTSHPQTGGGTVSNYASPGGGTGRWYLIAKGARLPFKFLVADDYEMDEDPNSFAENRTYRYRAFAQVGVGAADWRHIYSTDAAFNTANLNAAIAAMAAFQDDHGDNIGSVPGLVVAPFTCREGVLSTLATELTSNLQTNYNRGTIDHLITPWL